MIKKLTNFVLSLFINGVFFNPIFADNNLTEEFQSANLRFVPFSENNREEISAIMINSDCFPRPYRAWRKGEKLTSFINRYIKQNDQKNLGAWIIKINNNTIGLAAFIIRNIFDKDLKTGEQENYVELKTSKTPLQKKFQIYYPQIMNTLINYAFETDSSLEGIRFSVQESDELGLKYAMGKKFPCIKGPSNSTSNTIAYTFDISKTFYAKNKSFFK